MASQDRLSLAIRTIVITTRAAIRTQARAGQRAMAPSIARRGLTLLDNLEGEVPTDASDGIRAELAEARRELTAMADAPSGPMDGVR